MPNNVKITRTTSRWDRVGCCIEREVNDARLARRGPLSWGRSGYIMGAKVSYGRVIVEFDLWKKLAVTRKTLFNLPFRDRTQKPYLQ